MPKGGAKGAGEGKSTAVLPARHRLRPSDGTGESFELDLNEFNHCRLRFPDAAAFEAARAQFCGTQVSQNEIVEDGITGVQLRIADQVLNVETEGVSRGVNLQVYNSVSNVAALSHLA